MDRAPVATWRSADWPVIPSSFRRAIDLVCDPRRPAAGIAPHLIRALIRSVNWYRYLVYAAPAYFSE